MTKLVQDLLAALYRQRAIDKLSPAARALEQRDIDRIVTEAEQTLQASGSSEASLAARCLPIVERLLAEQGDRAEPDMVQLQHDLVGLSRIAANHPLNGEEISEGYTAP